MLSDELLKKIKRIEITTRKMVSDVMSGHYRSQFKGHGVQFSEHRVYMPGDDVRHIDWKVSARTREPLIKKFEEERELTVLLMVDVSGSATFGSSEKLKSEALAEIGGMLAYAASHTGDRVGVVLFSDRVELIIPPKKGRHHVLRIVREILAFKPSGRGTDIASALDSVNRLLKHSGVVFVLSDFMDHDFENSLKRVSRKHDVVAVRVGDRREKTFEKGGIFLVEDPETGEEVFVNSDSYTFKKWLAERLRSEEAAVGAAFKGARVEALTLSTQEDYPEAVVRFFRMRARRHR